jgi:hypothetical protein
LATIRTTTTTLGAIKLRAHLFLVDLAILVFVEGSQRLGGVLQLISTQGTVFIRVNRLHHRIGGAKSATTTKSTTITGTALSGTPGSSAFTAASTWPAAFTAASAWPAVLSPAKLFAEKSLNLLARGALVLIELAITVLVELLDHGFADILATATSAFTATSALPGAASAALSRAFLSL